jgi:predicted transglutaminase-like cysteine proteinase
MRTASVFSVLFTLSAFGWAIDVPANPSRLNSAQDKTQTALRVFGDTRPPYGFVQFCQRMPNECREGPWAESRVTDTPQKLAELEQLNKDINRAIEPTTDLDLYGVTEFWTIPTNKGDCEDYALLKRKKLIEAGWPIGALLMTVVLDEKNEGHAVLTVRLGSGDYILDNKTDEIRLWNKTPYHFVMRQSYLNPRVWMSLDPREAPSNSSPLAGVRSTQR